MSIDVYYNDFEEVIHRKCECGHELYQHGFVIAQSVSGNPNESVLWVSQCVMCKECERFSSAGVKDGSTKV